jgi:hypothetical protein
MLGPIPADLAERAVLEIIDAPGAFAPSIGDIRERCRKIALAANGVGELTADEAWEKVQHAIRFVGIYRYPHFENASIQRAVDALGWISICANDNIEATRAHFFRLFSTFEKRRVQDESALLLGDASITKLLESEKVEKN